MRLSALLDLLEPVPDDPFYAPRKPLWLPPPMALAPRLDAHARCGPIDRRFALLVNPFYAKSPHGSFVVGFDGDRKDTFPTLAEWIETNRLGCATFHILTPYPGTPLFRQLEAEGRLLHRNWDLYDTAHVVFQPRHLTPEELQLGYDWLYRRLFSHVSIWRRRPAVLAELPTYLAGAYLYKRSNRLWRFLIAHRLVHAVWRPLVGQARRRQVALRRTLLAGGVVAPARALPASCPVADQTLARPPAA